MIRLIVFDLDGPILDSFWEAKASVLKTRKRLIEGRMIDKERLPLPTKETFILSWGHPGTMVVKKLFPSVSDKEAESFVEIWAENEKEKRLPLIKGAKSALERIKGLGFNTALLTTRSHNLAFHFKRHGLEKYFDFFQSFDHPALPKEKVHPNHIFHRSPKDSPSFFDNLISWANQKEIPLKEALFVDDALVGLRLAKKIGLPFLGVCTGPLSSKKLWQKYGNLDPNYVINSIAELPGWLKKSAD